MAHCLKYPNGVPLPLADEEAAKANCLCWAGAGLTLCTLGLSWVPFYIFRSNTIDKYYTPCGGRGGGGGGADPSSGIYAPITPMRLDIPLMSDHSMAVVTGTASSVHSPTAGGGGPSNSYSPPVMSVFDDSAAPSVANAAHMVAVMGGGGGGGGMGDSNCSVNLINGGFNNRRRAPSMAEAGAQRIYADASLETVMSTLALSNNNDTTSKSQQQPSMVQQAPSITADSIFLAEGGGGVGGAKTDTHIMLDSPPLAPIQPQRMAIPQSEVDDL